MTNPIDYILNGSLIKGAFETYNQPFAEALSITNPVYGMLFIVFQLLTFIATRNLAMCFIVNLLGTILLWYVLDWVIKGFTIALMIVELGYLIYEWISK
jgi:hypothetical protein